VNQGREATHAEENKTEKEDELFFWRSGNRKKGEEGKKIVFPGVSPRGTEGKDNSKWGGADRITNDRQMGEKTLEIQPWVVYKGARERRARRDWEENRASRESQREGNLVCRQ